MRPVGDEQTGTMRPDFHTSISIDFQGAKITSDNDADHLKVYPALPLALGKDHQNGAGQSALCRFENTMLATGMGLKALEKALSRCVDTLLRRRNKRRLIIDVDSTDDPVHGNREGAATRFAWLFRPSVPSSSLLLDQQR